MTDYLTIPGGRGILRADTIESACVHVPRLPFTDEITGQLCACVLMIETRRCLHRFNFAVIDEARAVVEAAGVLLSVDAGGHAKRDQESAGVPLPALPSSRRETVHLYPNGGIAAADAQRGCDGAVAAWATGAPSKAAPEAQTKCEASS